MLYFANQIPDPFVKVMQNVITIAERHGLLIVFLNFLLSQGGLPLPAVPTVMTVAALARQSPYQIVQIILAAISGALISGEPQYRYSPAARGAGGFLPMLAMTGS